MAFLIAAAVSSFGGSSRAGEIANRSGNNQQFVVEHYAIDGEGHFAGSGKDFQRKVTSLFYGQRTQPAVLYPEVDSGWDFSSATRHGVQNSDHAPARPPVSRFEINRWTKENGLPANKVCSLHQSRDGFLWVGTVGGLARFDGVRFTVFDSENTAQMASNGSIVRAVHEDDQGRLWFGTKRGLLCREGNEFVPFPGQERLRGRMIHGLAMRSTGGFWIAHDEGVSWWDDGLLHDLPLVGVETPLCVLERRSGTLWIGSSEGVFQLDHKNPLATPTVLKGVLNDEPLDRTAARGLFEDNLNRLWIGFGNGVARIDDPSGPPVNKTRTNKKNGVRVPSFSRFTEDRVGRVWATAAVQEGIFIYHRNAADPEFVETPKMWDALCVLADREGAVWAGTHEGLIRLREQLFSPMRLEGLDAEVSTIKAVVEAANGSLFFAAQTFVGSWAGRTVRFIDFVNLGPARSFVPTLAIFAGRAWASDPRGGLIMLPDFRSGRMTNTSFQPYHPEIGLCRVLHTGHSGALWMASDEGLFRMTNPAQPIRLTAGFGRNLRVLLEDKSGGVWLGGQGGLDYWKDGRLAAAGNFPDSSQLNVLSLREDTDNSLWTGTESGLWVLRNGRLHCFGTGSGVPQSSIQGIVEDDFGRLWLNHDDGVARVVKAELNGWLADSNRTPAVTRFGIADGLSDRGLSASPQSCLKIRDGRLWFAKGTGLIGIDPAHCPPGTPAPAVYLEETFLNGEVSPPLLSTRLNAQKLRTIEFQFTTPSLHSPENVLVQHRLGGYDSDWCDSGPLRRVTYGNLIPGRYSFQVRARNHEGQWSDESPPVAFQVVLPVWQRQTFRVASGLLLLAACGGMGAWILGNRRRRSKIRETALAQERERLARDLHDHFAPRLAEIALASRLEDAARAAARITSDELPRIIWEVHPEYDTLSSLLDYLANFATRYLEAARISLELDLPSDVPNIPLPLEARRGISALSKESLHNVVRHARATQVLLAARLNCRQFELRITDNGCGFDSARLMDCRRNGSNGGHGLRNFHARCGELGGRYRLDTAPGQGTTVTFILPLARGK